MRFDKSLQVDTSLQWTIKDNKKSANVPFDNMKHLTVIINSHCIILNNIEIGRLAFLCTIRCRKYERVLIAIISFIDKPLAKTKREQQSYS